MTRKALTRTGPNPWWVAVVCGMASYIDAATIVATGIALVIYQSTIGITPTEIGVLSGALALGVAVGAIVGGRLGDRLGRRNVFTATMVIVIIGITLLVFSTTFPLLLAGVVLAGLGTGADLPVSIASISEAGSDKNRGAMLGLSSILWTVGTIGTIVIAIFAGGWGYFGGQVLFAHVGVLAVLVLIGRLTIPESRLWLDARADVAEGRRTIRADRARLRDLLRAPYLVPFAALLVFYAFTNVAGNTIGQFGTYLAVNVAGISVQLNSLVSLLYFPTGIIAGIWFMRVVDGRHRMAYFTTGAIVLMIGLAVPATFGFSVATLIVLNVSAGIGTAFAFDTIMKVWTQESFPTLLRSTAQGAIIAVARVVAALLAFVTPALIEISPQMLFWGLAGLSAIGFITAFVTFRNRSITQFDQEQQPDPDMPERIVASHDPVDHEPAL